MLLASILKKRNLIVFLVISLSLSFFYLHHYPSTTPSSLPPTNLYLLDPTPPTPYEYNNVVHSGIPSVKDYSTIAGFALYLQMVEFSKSWLIRHEVVLEPYLNTWAKDPFHFGNRPYEYLYTFLRIQEAIRRYPDFEQINVLELGSGLTFFPFWLAKSSEKVHILAVDSDPVYSSIFRKISEAEGVTDRVVFLQDDLRTTKAKKKKFEIVYCVSVLEHTANYGKISQHMKDLMVPGATVVITFSLSLDHLQDISEEKALHLLSELNKNFCDIDPFPVSISERIRQTEPIWSVSTLDKVDKSLQKPDSVSDVTVVTCTFRKCK